VTEVRPLAAIRPRYDVTGRILIVATAQHITKQQLVQAMQSLPDDAGVEEALERLRFMQAVEEGLKQLDDGQSLSQDEVERRLARWLR
jgi:predicted transcriptional regulator